MTPDLEALLSSPSDGSDRSLHALRERLAIEANAEGTLDIAFRFVDSPFGRLLLASTEVGVVRVAFATEDHELVLQHLSETISPRILASPLRTDKAARQLDDFFGRRRRAFDVPIDLQLVRGFRRDVISRLAGIEYGTTASYASVAKMTGNPAAVRAVGSACAHNPVPIILPCHRVIRSDGSLGQYLGGADVKAALLAIEAAA